MEVRTLDYLARRKHFWCRCTDAFVNTHLAVMFAAALLSQTWLAFGLAPLFFVGVWMYRKTDQAAHAWMNARFAHAGSMDGLRDE